MSLINKNIDILCFAETKLDSSFPAGQFFEAGYASPFRLDVSSNSGGLLVYINENIPSRILRKFTVTKDIQILPIEINFRKSKWLFLPIYRPDRTNKVEFLATLSNILDYYSNIYENVLINGDFNMEVTESAMTDFIKKQNLYSMIKTPTCFKGSQGRCIDLCLSKKRCSFINTHTHTFETGFNESYLLK